VPGLREFCRAFKLKLEDLANFFGYVALGLYHDRSLRSPVSAA
jgi:hypothetical protein